jgi:hypothetical protein
MEVGAVYLSPHQCQSSSLSHLICKLRLHYIIGINVCYLKAVTIEGWFNTLAHDSRIRVVPLKSRFLTPSIWRFPYAA